MSLFKTSMAFLIAFLMLTKLVQAETIIHVYPKAEASTYPDSMVLAAGKEYELNQRIREAANKSSSVTVIFADGVYVNVRIHLVKSSSSAEEVYMQEPSYDTMKQGINYHNKSKCNKDGINCRMIADDFALDERSDTPITLRAEHAGRAVFDGSDYREKFPDIFSSPITIAAAVFGAKSPEQIAKVRPISNVSLYGFVFKGYQDGVKIKHAYGVTIKNCVIEDIGTRFKSSRPTKTAIGVGGIVVSDYSKLVLISNVKIMDTWNIDGEGVDSWSGLMHSLYIVNSHDVVLIGSDLAESSGPLIKFGFYRATDVSGEMYNDNSDVASRRNFFLSNKFRLAALDEGNNKKHLPAISMLSFIHDNSVNIYNKRFSDPARGEVFISNSFVNEIGGENGSASVLRQELVQGSQLNLSTFVFYKNKFIGLHESAGIVSRYRGAKASDLQARAPLSTVVSLGSDIILDKSGSDTKTLSQIISEFSSADSSYDHLVEEAIVKKIVPRV